MSGRSGTYVDMIRRIFVLLVYLVDHPNQTAKQIGDIFNKRQGNIIRDLHALHELGFVEITGKINVPHRAKRDGNGNHVTSFGSTPAQTWGPTEKGRLMASTWRMVGPWP